MMSAKQVKAEPAVKVEKTQDERDREMLRLFHLDGRFGLDLFCAHHQSSLI